MSTFDVTRQTDSNGHEIIVVSGELDLATAHRVSVVASAWNESDDATPVRFDLAGVTFLDSTGLGTILEVRNAALAAGRRVEIVATSPAVDRVLSLTGLSDLFDPASGETA